MTILLETIASTASFCLAWNKTTISKCLDIQKILENELKYKIQKNTAMFMPKDGKLQ